MMDTMDGIVELDQVELATDNPEPYVLSWPIGAEVDGEGEASVLALMKREGGILLAVPASFFPNHVVEAANAGALEGLGPSATFQVPAVLIEGGTVARTGTSVDVLVIDCDASVLSHLRRFRADEEIIYGFDEDAPFNLPAVDALLAMIKDWLADSQGSGPAAFYTPEEEDPPKASPRATPRKATRSADGPKSKKPTTASLAAEVQSLSTFLPRLTSQLEAMEQRQHLLETRLVTSGQSASALASRPLSAALSRSGPPPLGDLAKSLGAPPRTMTQPSPTTLVGPETTAAALELQALQEEKPVHAVGSFQTSDPSLALAVLEQSRALTNLVAQIAASHSDPMADLSGSASSTSTKGVAGRAKLQAELAAHKGTFFTQVLHQMARRMAPTSQVDQSPATFMAKGISGLRYLERFGGYSRQRDLGQLQFQVMTIFDFLMEDNVPAARDSVALLAVTIEQMAMDGGRSDLATLLCLQEDPPSAIFQNRTLASTSRSRSFAPLADQRWITCALAFLKEMEVIQSKRLELTGGKGSASEPGQDNPRPKPKPNPKKKGRGKGQPPEEQEG